jgi:hypothetical protein
MENLRRIVAATEAQIVLSSSWRCTPQTIEAVNTALADVGIPPVVGCTPVRKNLRSRVAEIMYWLEQHERLYWTQQHPGCIDVKAEERQAVRDARTFVCLDDMDLATGARDGTQSAICDSFVHTNPDAGLTEADAEQAIEILVKRN